jgi:hypothetical protein
MSLNPVESFAIDHPGGEGRTLQFSWGDLTQMGPAEAVDILVVSALPGDYSPSQGSLIGALAAAGVSVEALAQNKAASYKSLPCWISQEFQPPSAGIQFKRLLVFEPANPSQSAAAQAWTILQALRCFFANQPVRVAMPLVSTGSGGADPTEILRALSWAAVHFGSSNSAALPQIDVVAYTAALAQQLKPVFAEIRSGYLGVFGLPLPGGYGGYVSQAQNVIAGRNVPASLTQRQAIAVCIYTTNYYGQINGTIRGHQPTDPQYREMFPLFEAIDSGLSNMVLHNGTTYRRENMSPERENEYQPGKAITNLAYTSTSLQSIWSGRDLLVFSAKNGPEVWEYSQYQGEQEVLFGCNFTFTVNTRQCDASGCTFGVTEYENNWCGG